MTVRSGHGSAAPRRRSSWRSTAQQHDRRRADPARARPGRRRPCGPARRARPPDRRTDNRRHDCEWMTMNSDLTTPQPATDRHRLDDPAPCDWAACWQRPRFVRSLQRRRRRRRRRHRRSPTRSRPRQMSSRRRVSSPDGPGGGRESRGVTEMPEGFAFEWSVRQPLAELRSRFHRARASNTLSDRRLHGRTM